MVMLTEKKAGEGVKRFCIEHMVWVEALNYVGRLVPNKLTNPSLGLILIEVSGNKLCLTGNNGAASLQVEVNGESEGEWVVALPGRVIMDLANRLEAGLIQICESAEKNQVILKTNKGGVYQLPCSCGDDFPATPVFTGEIASVSRESLLRGIQLVEFAMGKNMVQYVLNGIYMVGRNGNLELVASDSHRIALTTIEENIEFNGLVIPHQSVKELEWLLRKSSCERVTLQFEDKQVQFSGDNWRFATSLIDGIYPSYKNIIPNQFNYQAKLERLSLMQSLERLAIFVDSSNKVRLDFAGEFLNLSVKGCPLGNGVEQLPATITGGNLSIAFNIKYFLEWLKSMDSVLEIEINMNSPTEVAVFRATNDSNSIYLVAPMRISGEF